MAFPEYPYFFWILAVAAVLVAGISKAGFGGGVGMIATPLMALAIPVTAAVGIMLPLLIACDIFSVYHYRSRFDGWNLRVLLPGAVAGIVAGSLFFGYFSANERVLRTCVGGLAIGFVFFQAARERVFRLLGERKPGKVQGLLLGALSGFSSMLIHAGGPPAAVHLLPQRMPRDLYVGTTVVLFTSINLIKLIPYSLLGLLHTGQFWVLAVLAPVAFLGVKLGFYLNRWFSEVWFNRMIHALLLLTGVRLIF